MKLSTTLLCLLPFCATAQVPGGLTTAQIDEFKQNYTPLPSDRAIHNALNTADINTLAANANAAANFDDHFKYRVPSKGITNQQRSGRCWLFTGLNVLRAQAIRENNLPELEFSQVYNFFYDQLEKSNMFLQCVIDTYELPMDDRKVEFIFKSPVTDGGQFTGVADNLMKYGVVPSSAMPETYVSNHTATFSKMLSLKLRQWGLELRQMAAKGASAQELADKKQEMLSQVYRLLTLAYGTPPQNFTYTRRDSKGNAVETRTYTPQEFYQTMLGNDLHKDYIMLMNDASRPYYKLYEIDLNRHQYDGQNWTFINVPMDVIKEAALKSLKDSTALYFGCDVNKYLNRDLGTLDLNNYNYDDLLGVDFSMDKAQRITTGSSASTHAMTLVGVDVDENERPTKWLIENSWGNGANAGHLIATDQWMDEYLFRLVVNSKYLPKKVLKVLDSNAELLPAWDHMN